MNGTILFPNAAALAKFLREFTGATATFTVTESCGEYLLTFNGGY